MSDTFIIPRDVETVYVEGEGGGGSGGSGIIVHTGSSSGSSGEITLTTGTSGGSGSALTLDDGAGSIRWKDAADEGDVDLFRLPEKYAPDTNTVEIIDGDEIILNGMRLPMVRNFKMEKTSEHFGKSGRITIELDAEIIMRNSEQKAEETANDFMKELKSL